MSKEELDFMFFEKYQLDFVDFSTGRIDTRASLKKTPNSEETYIRIRKNVGSLNEDGYIRLWCNGSLRMKHRLLYWLYYHELPDEIDHTNRIRDDNRISNLRSVNRAENNKGLVFKGRTRFSYKDLHNICKDIASGNLSDVDIAKKYNCARTTIMGIRHKRRHSDIADLYF